MQNNVLNLTETYVTELLSSKLPGNNYYHNSMHTRRVVKMVSELAEHENCSEEEELLILIAAWFHDLGFIEKDLDHEEVSTKLALDFLKNKGLNAEQLTLITDMILATKNNVIPKTKLEAILKDADCSHVAMDDYMDVSENLHVEVALKTGNEVLELDWLKGNLEFLKNHKFYTSYAKREWQPKKELNQFKVQQRIDRVLAKKNKKDNKEKKEKSSKLGRGVETLFRVQLKNHIQLSAIADTKANILLSVNAIIISVALSNLIPKLDSPSNMYLVVPTLILMVFSVTSVVLSVLSTRPKVSNVKVTRDMIKNKQTNILFFGNFNKMSLVDFEWGIDYLINNEDALYNSLSKDLYYLGLVLERKYRLLRITYTVFMIGIVISALAFIISYYLTNVQH